MSTSVTLELDDIQSGVLRPRPTPYAATYLLFRIDDRRAGRELDAAHRRDRGPRPRTRRAPPPTRGSASRSPTTACGRSAFRQRSLDSFAWEFRQGMAARAHALGDTGESSPEHWERPLGTPRRPRRAHRRVARRRAARGGARARARRSTGASRGSRRSGARTATRSPPARSPSDSGTASATRRSRAAAFPAPIVTSSRSKAGEFVLGYPDETGEPAADAAARRARAQRDVRGLPQAPPARGGVPPVPRRRAPRARRRRGAPRGQDDGALAERRAAGALPAPRRSGARRRSASATTTSSSRDDPIGYKTPPGCHVRRAQPARRRRRRRARGSTG